MRGQWVYNQNFWSKTMCEKVIELALKIPPEKATLGFDGKETNNDFRKSVLRWIKPENPDFYDVFAAYWNFIISINKYWYGFNINNLPHLQFTEYDESYKGEYKSHQDVFWIDPLNTISHRKISAIVQLSDETTYDGGELILENCNEYPPKDKIKTQGSILTFPSFINHRLTPVTRGRRYSLVGWFEGPKFT